MTWGKRMAKESLFFVSAAIGAMYIVWAFWQGVRFLFPQYIIGNLHLFSYEIWLGNQVIRTFYEALAPSFKSVTVSIRNNLSANLLI